MNTSPVPRLRLFLLAMLFAAALPAPAATRAAAAATVAAAPTLEACSWDRPGHDPFMGDVVGAVDRYDDIPADVRARLKARMAKRDYDDVVSIRRDSIAGRGKSRYGSAIRDMHFGNRTLCHTVSRAAWTAQTQERGLVYCDSRQCILVPTVCRNVSRITRAEVANERAEEEAGEPLLPVALFEPELAPLPAEPAPPLLALGSEPAPEATAADDFYVGGFGGSGGGAVGSFAAAVAGAPPAAAAGDQGFGRVTSAPGSVEPVTAPVPEPETWALMLGGLALIGAVRRRRSSRRRR